MNKEEILAMEVGRRLNELVAEEVLEFRKDKDNFWQDSEGKYVQPPRGFQLFGVLSDYSGDILAAWQVVERMYIETGMFLLRWSPVLQTWMCSFYSEEDECEGKAAPEAICKAALLVKPGGKK